MTTDQIAVATGTKFLTDIECKEWVQRWQDRVNSDNADLSYYFQDKNSEKLRYAMGVAIDGATMFSFIATVGLQTVSIKFGIDEEDNFRLILTGIDRRRERITPYIAGSLIHQEDLSSLEQIYTSQNRPGVVPKALAEDWSDNWKTQVAKVNTSMFDLPNPSVKKRLQGYSYPLNELIGILFPNSEIVNPRSGRLYMCFSLHNTYRVDSINDSDITYFFGLLSKGVFLKSSTAIEVFFDDWNLTAPCPPTCHGDWPW